MDWTTVELEKFVESNPELYFASMNGEIENDMLKHILSENIKHTQALLDPFKNTRTKQASTLSVNIKLLPQKPYRRKNYDKLCRMGKTVATVI